MTHRYDFADPADTEIYLRELDEARVARDVAIGELTELRALINRPHIAEFFEAVKLEAAHQRDACDHRDDEKTPDQWYWTLGWLMSKSVHAFARGDREKGLHHIVSSAALLANWFSDEKARTP